MTSKKTMAEDKLVGKEMIQCSCCHRNICKEEVSLDRRFLERNKKCLNCSLIDGEDFCTKCLSSFKKGSDNWTLIKEKGKCFVCLVRELDKYSPKKS